MNDYSEQANREIASLQSQLIEEQKKSNRYLTAWEKRLEEIEQFKSQLEAQDKQVEGWKNLHKEDTTILQKQLQEAKAEVEKFAQWWDDNVVKLYPTDDWYSEGYRYRFYLSGAKNVRVKTFDELYSHFKSQLSTQTTDKG